MITLEILEVPEQTSPPEIMYITLEVLHNSLAIAIPTKVSKMALIDLLYWNEFI